MNEREVFLAALNKPMGADRRAFLDNVCEDAPDLRNRVEALLAAHEQAGSFLESHDAAFTRTVTGPQISERPGTTIGHYRLLEQIGEGGFGVVFMAEQSEPVRRKVALKVIKPGMDTRQVIARFEAERQALALMDHPHIARVLDAGATESGRPYFVMELVNGIPITQFCDQHQLTVPERLELFMAVCHAAQHAHQKGIIHRDIKPSNVLVTLHDDRPVVKVIDFGVAKATSGQLTDRTLFTGFMQMLGTPLYMSPEQTALSGVDVDTRSDIYSLGVLLYELLTGTTPFDRRQLESAAVDEMRRIIREEEPKKPSTRLSMLGDSVTTLAMQRRIEPNKLGRLLRGDLDWIVMKALEKDRSRRYETASGFARDIQRHLDDEVIEARPPSTGYRLRKVIRRNKAALTTIGVVAFALITGTAVSTWQAIRATRAEQAAARALVDVRTERDKAVRAEQRAQQSLQAETAARVEAEENLAHARGAVEQFFTLISQNRLFDLPNLQPLRLELLEAAVNYYEALLSQRPDDPSLIADLAIAYMRIAPVHYDFDRLDHSIDALSSGLEQINRLRSQFPDSHTDQMRLAGFWKPLRGRGRSEWPTDIGKVTRTLEALVATYTDLHEEFPTVEGFESDLAAALLVEGAWKMHFPELQSAGLEIGEESLARWKRLMSAHPMNADYYDNFLETLANLEYTYTSRGVDPEKGKVYRERLTKEREAAYLQFPKVPRFREYQSLALGERSGQLFHAGRIQEACEARQQALDLMRDLCHEFPAVAEYAQRFSWNAGILIDLGRTAGWDEAQLEGIRREAEAISATAQRLADAFDSPEESWVYAESLARNGELLLSQGSPEAAASTLRRSLEMTRKLTADDPQEVKYRMLSARMLRLLGESLDSEGRCKAYAEAEETVAQLHAEHPQTPEYLNFLLDTQWRLAEALKDVGRQEDANALLEDLQANLVAHKDDAQVARHLAWECNQRAWCLVVNADVSDHNVVRSIADAELAVKLRPAESAYWNTLGVAQFRGGNWDAAETALRKSMDLNKGGYPADWFFLAMIDWQRGQKDRARHWFDAAAMWTARYASNNEEVIRFRAEAQGLLGITELTIPDEFDDGTIGKELLAADDDLEGYLVFRAKADAAIREFDWKAAAPHAVRAAEVLPGDDNLELQLSAILARVGDEAAYRDLCRRMLARHSDTTVPEWAERTAKACLLLPVTGDDLDAACRLADKALTLDETHWVIPYAQVVAAMAAYRRGEFAAAIDWCDKALTKEAEHVWFRNAEALFVRALAEAGLGHHQAAIEDYTRASDILIEAQKTARASPVVDPAWQDFAMCELLQQEAQHALIVDTEAPPVSEP